MRDNINRMIDFLLKKSVEQINKRIEESKQEGIKKVEESKEEIQVSIKKVARQDTKLIAEFQSNTEEVRKLNIELQNTQLLIQSNLSSQLEEVKEVLKESMKLRRDINDANIKFDREMQKWQNFSIRFLDTMERTLEHLQDHNLASVKDIEKVIDIFSKDVRDMGIEVINPKRNEKFNYEIHKCDLEEEAKNVPPENVIKCNKWGYKVNGNLYKPAKVIVSKRIESPEVDSANTSTLVQTGTTVTSPNSIKSTSGNLTSSSISTQSDPANYH
jgi:molecular chaperone GrpE